MKKFEDICGYEKVKEHIQGAVREKRPAHAYIISGPKYAGKKTLSEAFAGALLCEKGGESPCMECTSCKQILSGNHPDVIYVKRTKTTMSIDDVREQIRDTIITAPYKSRYKIYIMDEAETMRSEAQNALLKTLEEPPEYAIIILLTTAKDLLLETILSRCVNLDLRPIEDAKVIRYLMEKHQVVDYQARLCAAYAGGNVGKAIRIADSPEFLELQNETLDMLSKIKDTENAELVDKARHLSEYKLEIDDFFDIMMLWYRDVLLYKATADANVVVFGDRIHEIRRLSEKETYSGIQSILDMIAKSRERIAANVNVEIVMELLLFAMKSE